MYSFLDNGVEKEKTIVSVVRTGLSFKLGDQSVSKFGSVAGDGRGGG